MFRSCTEKWVSAKLTRHYCTSQWIAIAFTSTGIPWFMLTFIGLISRQQLSYNILPMIGEFYVKPIDRLLDKRIVFEIPGKVPGHLLATFTLACITVSQIITNFLHGVCPWSAHGSWANGRIALAIYKVYSYKFVTISQLAMKVSCRCWYRYTYKMYTQIRGDKYLFVRKIWCIDNANQ